MAGSLSPRRGGGRRNRRMVNDINVVPYIDVMLVLLVIFMVTAPLLPPTQIELPTVGSSKQVDNEYVEVLIQADNELRVRRMNAADPSERTIALGDLTAVVREMRAQPTTPVVISADKSVRYELVVNALDRLQRIGARVGLMVKPESQR